MHKPTLIRSSTSATADDTTWMERALELEHPDLLGVCLSGSGPSIVAIAERSHREIGELLGSVYQRSGLGYRVRTLQAHQKLSEHVRVFRSGLLCC